MSFRNHGVAGLATAHATRLSLGAALAYAAMTPTLSAGREVSRGYATREILEAIGVRREFTVWATDRWSPIVEWLKALAARVHGECGGSAWRLILCSPSISTLPIRKALHAGQNTG